MHSFFGESIENYNVETWRDAMEAIKNGDADYAVLPIENSTAGIVADIYDLLVEYHHSIVGEPVSYTHLKRRTRRKHNDYIADF